MHGMIDKLQHAGPMVLVVSGGAVAGLLALLWLVKSFLYVCPPNQVLIFSGRNRTGDDGRKVGFRVIVGGRAFRVPVLENVQAMDLTNIAVPMSVAGAYSEGAEGALGIPLSVSAIANVKVSSDPRFIGNAIERFLGHDKAQIAEVAKQTLEGHLRGVVAKMTPEEVNEDRLKFGKSLAEEVERDLEKLGLHLDTLKISHVADDRNYLESIGRTRIAEVLRAAEVAESDAQRATQEAEAAAKARGEVAQTNAQANILRKQNELRQIQAELEATAASEEERAKAAAQAARAEAEQELQRIRGDLEQLRLGADVTIPAEVARQVRELEAAGKAASIAQNGKAQAEALQVVAEAWEDSEGRAMEMFVLQNLEPIFARVTAAAKNIKVREVNLVDSGTGTTLPAYVGSYPATVSELLREVKQALGVDITKVLTGESNGSPGHAASPRRELVPPTPPSGGASW